jgi:hypothetical protein
MTARPAHLPDLAARLRQLADQVAELEPAQVVGALEALKFAVWTAATVPGPPLDAAVGTSYDAPVLDRRAAATYLGISVTAVRRHEARGVLAAVCMGRRVGYRRATLDAFLAAHEGRRVDS